jgi:histidine triad (HIT) family protein
MKDCLFCKIINQEIPSKKVFENETIYAFEDIDKKAPTHILIIPKKHINSVALMTDEDMLLMSEITKAARDIAEAQGIDKSGYRLVINHGSDGGQAVSHIHMHLLGGRSLTWPPG